MAPPLLWFVSGCLLLALALVGFDNDGLLLVGGLSGLLLTLLAIALPLPAGVQIALFLALVGVGYGLLRHWDRSQRDRSLTPSANAERAEVISGFEGEAQGRVRWQGQSWAAENLDPQRRIAPGAEVTVMGREGTRLQVLPR